MKKSYKITVKSNRYDSVIIEESGNMLEVSYHLIHSKKPFEIESVNYRLLSHINDSLARWIHDPLFYASAESILQAEKTIKRMIAEQKRYIKNSVNHPAYNGMLARVKAHVKHYFSDFYTHDKIQLGKNQHDEKFIWMIRESGTWFLNSKNNFTEEIIKQELKECRHNIYFYDGKILNPITRNELKSYYNELKDL